MFSNANKNWFNCKFSVLRKPFFASTERTKEITYPPYQAFHNLVCGVQFWDVHQEPQSHRSQGIGWPLREPVDGTTVNQGRELSQTGSENLS
jgi:hypothetical protein